MFVCRRRILAGAGAVALIGIGGGRPASAKDKLTEANMTKADYDRITETKSSVPDQPPAPAPTPVHNFSDRNSDSVKEEHGTRLLKGKEWKDKTPEERDAYLREIQKNMPEGSRLVLTVPKGELWLIPPEGYEKLTRDRVVRPWTDEERARIPRTIGLGDGASHSDISGTMVTRRLRIELKP